MPDIQSRDVKKTLDIRPDRPGPVVDDDSRSELRYAARSHVGTDAKKKLLDAMNQIASITLDAPVNLGDIVCHNIAQTGIALVACRTVLRTREG